MKYQTKTLVVEADYYKPGEGLETGIKTKQVSFLSASEKAAAITWYSPEVLADKTARIQLPYIFNYYTREKNGRKEELKTFNFIHADHVIITEASGKRSLIKAAEFEALYVEHDTDLCNDCGNSKGQQKALTIVVKGTGA